MLIRDSSLIFLWIMHFYEGDAENAQMIMDAIKRHVRLGDSLEMNLLEGVSSLWTEGYRSEKIVGSFHEVKRILETLPHHACDADPCDVCYERLFFLAQANFCIGEDETIEAIDNLLRLYDDDIMVRFMRGQAWLLRTLECSETETEVAASYYTQALSDFEKVDELLKTLPDDRVYLLRTVREKATEDPQFIEDFYQCIDNFRFVQEFRGTFNKKDTIPLPFDPLSIPRNVLRVMQKHLTASALTSLERVEEARVLFREALKMAEEVGDVELIADVMVSFAAVLDPDNRNDARLRKSVLTVTREIDDKELSAMLLYQFAEQADQTEEMIELLKESVATARVSGNEGFVNNLLSLTIEKLFELERPDDALPLLGEAFADIQSEAEQSEEVLKTHLQTLVACLPDLKKPLQALPILREIYTNVRSYDNEDQFNYVLYAFAVYLSKLRTAEDVIAFFEMVKGVILSEEHPSEVLVTLAVALSVLEYKEQREVLLLLTAAHELVQMHNDEELIAYVMFFEQMYVHTLETQLED